MAPLIYSGLVALSGNAKVYISQYSSPNSAYLELPKILAALNSTKIAHRLRLTYVIYIGDLVTHDARQSDQRKLNCSCHVCSFRWR
jgi:hypothetical protein